VYQQLDDFSAGQVNRFLAHVDFIVFKCFPNGTGGAHESALLVNFMALLPDSIAEGIPKGLVCLEYVERSILDGKIAGK
jgi:hypothetical protein